MQFVLCILYTHVLVYHAFCHRNTENPFHGLKSSLSSSTFVEKPQILSFHEPTTNVKVILVGAMHYNPWSISLAAETIKALAIRDQLHSTVIESCPDRWKKTLERQPQGSIFRALFDNEMQTAADVSLSFSRSLVLGDQNITITNTRMMQLFAESILDLMNPFNGGWSRISDEIKSIAAKIIIKKPNDRKYLSFGDFFSPYLLLGAPVSLIRYPLAIIFKSPLIGLAIACAIFLTNGGSAANISELEISSHPVVELFGDSGTLNVARFALDYLISALAFAVEVAVLSRVFLTGLLGRGTSS